MSERELMYAFDGEGEAEATEAAQAATADVLSRVAPGAKTPRPALRDKTTGPDFLTKHRFIIAALSDRSLSDRGKVMLAVLVEEYRADWGCAKRSHAFLAERAGTSERTGRRAVDDCVKAGWLLKHVDRKGKDSEVNMYRPAWEKAATMRPDLDTASDGTCGQMWPHGMAKAGHTVWPDLADESHLDSTERTTVGKTGNPFSNEDPEDPVSHIGSADMPPKMGLKEDRSSKPWIEPAVIDGWWDLFRDAYPHEPGLAKAKGMFCKVILEGKVTIDDLLAAVERYTDEINATGMAFANATRWLCDERWTDEYDSPPVNAAKAATPPKASDKPPVAPKPAAPAPQRTGTLITAEWRPTERAWDPILADEGEEDTEDALRAFVAHYDGYHIENPDAQWAAHCREFFAPF